MSVKIQVKSDPDTGESYIDMADLSDFFEDPSLVHSYELKELENKQISLTFYDKDKKVLKLKKIDNK